MRVAYFLADPGIGIFGTKGASVHAQEMIRAFRALGHEVTVYCTKRGDRSGEATSESVPVDLQDLPVFVVPVAGVKGAAAREQATMRTARRMADLAAESHYDLIYERYSLFSDAGAHLARQIARPTDSATTARAPADGVPLIVEVNAPLLAEQSAHRSLHDAEGAMRATLSMLNAADVISCVSAPVADWVRRLTAPERSDPDWPGRIPPVVVTPNGVNTSRFVPRAHSPGRPFTVGFLGTLKPWHGTEFLLEAFATAPDRTRGSWRCEIIGDGPQRQHLEQLAAQLGIRDQVQFHGALPPSDVPAALAGWDAGAAPYPDPEEDAPHYFSPLKVYEYMAAGLPVVASSVGEIPQLIEHRGSGLLVPGSDVDALCGALAELAGDQSARTRMGAQARAEAVSRHSWASRAEGLLIHAHTPSPKPALEVIS